MEGPICDNKFGKKSQRANSIEQRRLEQELRSFDNAKRAMAVDTRKAQGEYKKKLLFVKNRQKDLMMSKSGASLTESSMGEYLLQSLISRQSATSRRRKPSGRNSEDIASWRQEGHTSPTTDATLCSVRTANVVGDNRDIRHRPSSSTPTPSLGATPYFSTTIDHQDENNDIRAITATASVVKSQRDTNNNNNNNIHNNNKSTSTGSRPISSSISNPKSIMSNGDRRPKTSSPSVKILESLDTDLDARTKTSQSVKILEHSEQIIEPKLKTAFPFENTNENTGKYIDTAYNNTRERAETPVKDVRVSSIRPQTVPNFKGRSQPTLHCASESEFSKPSHNDHHDLELISLGDDESAPDEFGAEEELGRISNRHRSKLDLRPGTAWRRMHGSADGSRRAGHHSGQGKANPFSGLKGRLAAPWKQVRFFDQDEIEERGMFYKLLLKDRLNREHKQFQSICVKVTQFSCDRPLEKMGTS